MANRKENLCDPHNYSILVPYKDFENLVGIAREYQEILKVVKHQDEQLVAMRQMFSECLEKIAEIDRYL